MTRQEKKEELIGLFCTGAIYIGDLIDECFEFVQQHPHWISVEDELPNDGAYVVTINKVGLKEVRHFYHDKWFSSFGNEYGDVTHWMPIPQPPKEIKGNQRKNSPNQQQIIGTADHIKIAIDVMDKKGGEK